mmetsp:Transcript_4755/g.10296  ORF Transcript_4755/g.10296 Transcript_4755/m.10296 type:complete len:259 (-) Transcript_4755:451-1227(-)
MLRAHMREHASLCRQPQDNRSRNRRKRYGVRSVMPFPKGTYLNTRARSSTNRLVVSSSIPRSCANTARSVFSDAKACSMLSMLRVATSAMTCPFAELNAVSNPLAYDASVAAFVGNNAPLSRSNRKYAPRTSFAPMMYPRFFAISISFSSSSTESARYIWYVLNTVGIAPGANPELPSIFALYCSINPLAVSEYDLCKEFSSASTAMEVFNRAASAAMFVACRAASARSSCAPSAESLIACIALGYSCMRCAITLATR